MAVGINMICRQLLKLKAFRHVEPGQMSVRSVASNVCNTPSLGVSKLIMRPPPSSIDFRDSLTLNGNVYETLTPRPQILDMPIIGNNTYKIDLPMIKSNIRYEDVAPTIEIQDPNSSNVEEKHAVRMIVIRRRKMRIHKLKKLRKKMKFLWDKVKQRRRAEKEKAFQAEMMSKIKEANKFDPAIYVKEKIAKANEVRTPKYWHGKRLPEFIIKDLVELRKKKILANEERVERRRNMNINASDYK